jgi:hypothetical protein
LLRSFGSESLHFGFGTGRRLTLLFGLDSLGGQARLFSFGSGSLFSGSSLFYTNLLCALRGNFLFFEAFALLGLSALFFEAFLLESYGFG